MRTRALLSRSSLTRSVAGGAALLLGAGLALAGTTAASAAPVTVDIVDINDFHGRLTQSSSAPAAGAAALAGYVDSVRAENPNTLFVSAGDNIGASTFESAVQNDEPTLDVLNQMGLVASAAGNHEFDKGFADLDGRVKASADFPYLAANVTRADGSPAFDEYAIEDVAGVKVGFVGAVTEDLPNLVSAAGIAGLTIGSIVDSVNRVAEDLQDGDPSNGEADVVVALIHEGPASGTFEASTDQSVFGRIVAGLGSDVDVIFGAHTHVVTNHVIGGRPVMSAGQYGENAARLSFTYDAATDTVAFPRADIVPLSTDTDPSPTVSNWVPNYPADQAVAATVAAAVTRADQLGAAPLGSITADFNRARQSNGTTENRGGESTIGNFVADVHLWATRELGTQVAFMNPGGIRDNLRYASSGTAGDADGVVTYREAAIVQPFANTLVTVDMTGAQIKQVLENQWQPAGASRPFLKLGTSQGLTYTYDPAAAAGSHITEIRFDGDVLAPTDTLKVVANSFLAAGGDNFSGFTAGTNRADSGRVDLQAMVDYLGTQTAPVSPDLAQRAVGLQVSSPANPTGFHPGEVATFTLSSLLFSTSEAKPTTAEARIAGTLVGSAAIDPSVVDTTDEVGRASLAVTVPSNAAPGIYDVVVTTPGTSTTVTVPLTVAASPVTPAPVVPLPDDSLLVPANSGNGTVSATTSATVGSTVTIAVDPAYNGQDVEVFLYSSPVSLGRHTVQNGAVTVTIPAGTAPGAHKIAVYATDGTLIGWTSITITAAAGTGTGAPGPSAGQAASSPTGRIASTGSDAGRLAGPALLASLLGLVLVGVTRRRHPTTR